MNRTPRLEFAPVSAAGLHSNPSVRAQLRATGERITPARAAVFALLHESGRALSHQEIESGLGRAHQLDRVTVYRVLEWLVEQGLAHKVAGLDRVWRFSIAREAHDRHAHFQCSGCGKVVCLAEVATRRVPLPRGFRSERVEVTVKGRCAECA
jgi:Fur family ferric uptake transcriptional regulator